jgi:hypothetical protein
VPATHRQGLGNTAVMEQALATGGIDVYPEYTGTIARELLKQEGSPSLAQLNAALAAKGLKAAVPLGFNNSYALAMREDEAARLGIVTISDLARSKAPLRFGPVARVPGARRRLEGAAARLRLPFAPGSGLDHGLAYQALAAKQVDVVDAYGTDAQIARLGLRVLRGRPRLLPRYDAVLLMRARLDERLAGGAGGTHRRGGDARHERRGGDRRQVLRGGGARVPRPRPGRSAGPAAGVGAAPARLRGTPVRARPGAPRAGAPRAGVRLAGGSRWRSGCPWACWRIAIRAGRGC